MGSADQGIVDAIMRARMQGRGPDSMQPHNPEWFGYKNYPNIFNGMDSGDYEGYMFQNEPYDDQEHISGTYAQYKGQPDSPDIPSARDLRRFDSSRDPEMRRRFEEYFGTEAAKRASQGATGDKSYVPTPRARPSTAPLGPTSDEYTGDQSGMMGPFNTEGVPRPAEVYSYMPGLKDRIQEHLLGPGVARESKSDYADPKFPQAFDAFSNQPSGNIQDLRSMAIEQMMKRSADAQQGPGEAPEQSMAPAMSSESIDDMIQRHMQGLRQQQFQDDPELEEFARRR